MVSHLGVTFIRKIFGVFNLQSAVCGLQSAVCSLQSAICGLRSAVCSLQSAVCSLQSANFIHRTGKAFSSKLLIIMLHSNAWTLKAITCRGSTLLFKNKCASGIFCIRNSPEFLRMKTGISTGVSETRSQLWKDSQLKISVLMQRLFLLVARLVYSGKTEATPTK